MNDDANERCDYGIKRYALWCFTGDMGVDFFPFVRPLFRYLTGHCSFDPLGTQCVLHTIQ